MKNLDEKLDSILLRHKDIETKLSNTDNIETQELITLNKEYSELLPLVETINEYKKCAIEITNLKELSNDQDTSIKDLAESEIKRIDRVYYTSIGRS